MDTVLNQHLTELNDVKDVLRALSRMQEVQSGTFRIASGALRGQFSFQDGHIVSASTSSGVALRGKPAFEAMITLPEIVTEFVAEQAPLADPRDELCIEIAQLIQNHFSLEGMPWAPRAGSRVRTKTGQLPSFLGKHVPQQDDVDTVSLPAAHTAELIAKRKELDAQEATGPMPVQRDPAEAAMEDSVMHDPEREEKTQNPETESKYDLSALDAIPTPGSGGAPKPAAPAAQQSPQPAQPKPATPAYDLSALEAIPTPGSGGMKAAPQQQLAQPQPVAQPPQPAQPQPMPQQPAPATPAYDLSALEAIPTPGSGKLNTPPPQVVNEPSPFTQPAAKPAAPTYDLSALDSIPTPGSKPAQPQPQPQPQETAGFMKRMAQSTEHAKPAEPQPAPHVVPETPQPTVAKEYDLSALDSIPTPGAASPKPAAPSPLVSMTSMTNSAPTVPPPVAPQAPASSADALIGQWHADDKPTPSFPMERIAGILLVITIALAAFVVPGMIRQSMKPANVEQDMNKQQMNKVVTDQMKEQTPYAH